MYILGIDSSTDRLSIAVSIFNQSGSFKSMRPRTIEHSSHNGFMKSIMGLIEKLLKKSGLDTGDIDVFCVNRGPGDFTGTRIGISVIKTFALVNNKPSYGIDTLDIAVLQAAFLNRGKVLAAISEGYRAYIVPSVDVKRDEVFFSVYEASLSPGFNSSCRVQIGSSEFFINKIMQDRLTTAGELLPEIKDYLKDMLLQGYPKCRQKGKNIVLFCGNAFLCHSSLAYGVKELSRSALIEKGSFHPEAGYLNMCALYRMEKQPDAQERIMPYYAREFVPFKKK